MQWGHVTICNDVIKGGAFDLQWKNQLHAHDEAFTCTNGLSLWLFSNSTAIDYMYIIISAVALIRGLMLKKHGGPNLCLKSI